MEGGIQIEEAFHMARKERKQHRITCFPYCFRSIFQISLSKNEKVFGVRRVVKLNKRRWGGGHNNREFCGSQNSKNHGCVCERGRRGGGGLIGTLV